MSKGKLYSQLKQIFSGQKTLEIDGEQYQYIGELDKDGNAYGEGIAKWEQGEQFHKIYDGTFLDD